MSRRVPNAANRSSPSVMNPRSMLAQPVWQPRQCSITGDDGQRWRGPLKGTRPVTPTEAASRRAWGRQERPYLYLFETDSSAAFSRMRRSKTPPAHGVPRAPNVPPLATTRRAQTATRERTRRTLQMTMGQRSEERARSMAASGFRNLEFPTHADTTSRAFGAITLTAPMSPVAKTRLKTLLCIKED